MKGKRDTLRLWWRSTQHILAVTAMAEEPGGGGTGRCAAGNHG